MKILITGGAGFVGTTLTPYLLEKGMEVCVFDNLMYGGNQLLPFFRNPDFEFIKGDVRNEEEIKAAVKGRDIIIHLAAIVGYPACRKEPRLARDVNVEGTKNLIKSLSKDQLVIYASTGSNYGKVDDVCTEETPLNPLSLYGQTKTLAEYMLLEKCKTVAYRFATAFGVSPRLRLDLLINDFVYRALTEGYLIVYEKHFMRTFIHVFDMARAFLFAIENADRMVKEVYNVGSDSMNYSKEQICELIQKKISCYVHYASIGEDKDKRDYVVSYEKIKKVGYETTISVEEGIEELKRALYAVQIEKQYTNV
ncbi:MAG: NAD(P)-dependent oxidoreductase [Spirochaetota bacterium]|nr:MAG: NAD(P)-dependent oxidoreductase [Spirochaetota bacterium]